MDVLDRADLPFPHSLPEFQRLFPDDAACAAYLEKARWGDGFACPHCGTAGEPFHFENRPGVLRCRKCRQNTGLTVGTVMERSHTPLNVWFWAAYLVASQTPGMSAVQFQRQLGLSRYETAFQILHKLRSGMVRPNQDRIGGQPKNHRPLGLPVPARDESRSEYKLAEEWRSTFAAKLGWVYEDWLPEGVSPRSVIEKLSIPDVPYWSFFEGLPVVEEGTSDPDTVGAAYDRLARLIFYSLDWAMADSGLHPSRNPDVLRGKRKTDEIQAELAHSLLKEAEELVGKGDNTRATAALREAVEIYSALARANPGRYDPPLADALNNWSNRLGEAGRRTEASTAVEEAVAIYRRLAAEDPARYEPGLARSLSNCSVHLSEVGRRPEALAAIEEAVAIRAGWQRRTRRAMSPSWR